MPARKTKIGAVVRDPACQEKGGVRRGQVHGIGPITRQEVSDVVECHEDDDQPAEQVNRIKSGAKRRCLLCTDPDDGRRCLSKILDHGVLPLGQILHGQHPRTLLKSICLAMLNPVEWVPGILNVCQLNRGIAMRQSLRGNILLTVAAYWSLLGGQPVAQADEFHLNGRTFTLPAGFEIELAAGPPLVDRPIVADFDEQGRLYVADSSGSNDRVEKQLRDKPHRILRLEDTDGDGRFDRRTVFADQMMFPEGALWYAGSLYVAAPPSIWKLTDTLGKGVANQRGEWFQGKTLTGCANDLHGPYLGRDGWIYWCKGAFAKQTYERSERPPFVTKAAHIFRCRPDGTGIEPVMTGGMDNPVEVVFTPGGERIFTTTFLQSPAGGKRDGLIHAIYGGIYGKDHAPIYEHKWTGPGLMPVLTHLGPPRLLASPSMSRAHLARSTEATSSPPSSTCERSPAMY